MHSPLVVGLALSLAAAASARGAPAPPAPAAHEVSAPAEAVVADAKASPYGLFLAGEAARDEGHIGAAAAFLTRAAAAEGEPPFLAADAFTAALQAGDISAAAAIAPGAPGASGWGLGVLTRGVDALARHRDRQALALFTSSGVDFPERVATSLLAPFAAAGLGDSERALQRPVIEGDPSGQFVADLDRAGLYERFGRAADAEAAFKALIAAGDPSNLAVDAYAGFLERQGRFADAARMLKGRASASAGVTPKAPAAPSLEAGAAQALIVPAAVLIQQKDQALALAYLRLALRLDPLQNSAWEMVGDILLPADPDAARAAYEHVSPVSPRYAEVGGKLAWSDEKAGDHDRALAIAREVAAARPDDRDAQSTLAGLLIQNQRNKEAVDVLSALISAEGSSVDWRLYYLRATAREALGDQTATEADLQAALKLAPDEPELLNFQGYFWLEQGRRLKEALALIEQAAAAEPQSGEIADSLGWAYYRVDDVNRAVPMLERAVVLAPSVPEINDHLGDAYWRAGRKLEAEFQWRRVLTLLPSDKLRAAVEKKLNALPQGPAAPNPPGREP